MPASYAKRLAARLIEDHEDEVTVDVPNHGFADQVVVELKKLGLSVVRDPFKPQRLTISRSKEHGGRD